MGRGKKKHRTHVKGDPDQGRNIPKTLVFKRGSVGNTVKELITDVRQVMLPFTAPKLKERRSNVIKDFLQVAGPLGVTHFIIFTQTDLGTYLRMARTPGGPTLTFQVASYSLAGDVKKIQQRPHSPGVEFKTAPVLVLNGFTGVDQKHVELMKVSFKDMFPSLSVDKVNLDNCRRVVMINYDPETEDIEFRHYLINASRAGVNKSIKNVVQKRVSDLSDYNDISDYVLGDLGATESDVEDDGAQITEEKQVTKTVTTRRAQGRVRRREVTKTVTNQSKIRLQEIGPRMTLKLLKIEDKLMEGEVHYHRLVKKTEEEIAQLKAEKEEQRRVKELRKKAQESRVKIKAGEEADSENSGQSGEEASDNEGDENIEWYRKEVGEEPDEETKELLRKSTTSSGPTKRDQKRYQKSNKRKQGGDNDKQQNTRPNRKEPPQKRRKLSSNRK